MEEGQVYYTEMPFSGYLGEKRQASYPVKHQNKGICTRHLENQSCMLEMWYCKYHMVLLYIQKSSCLKWM